MSSYYEALPIFRAAMDMAMRVDKAVQCFPRLHHPGCQASRLLRAGGRAGGPGQPERCGNVKHRHLAHLFEPLDPSKEEALP
jgi:hypothetical protein